MSKKTYIYCKNEKCKKLVEKTQENNYICSNCDEPLLDDTGWKSAYINMNPFSRQTKMEMSTESMDKNVKRFTK